MSAPSGWYTDPAGRDGLRYWDGERWTDQFQPRQMSAGTSEDEHDPPSSSEPPSPPSVQSVGKAAVQGHARAVERQHVTSSGSQGGSWHYVVTNFRVEQYDARGNRLRPVAVYFKTKLDDDMDINDGDEVVVWGKWKEGVLQAKRVESLTTGASTSAPKGCAATVLVIAACTTVVCASIVHLSTVRSGRL